MEVSLKNIIAPSFYELHRIIKRGEYTHYWLNGGRCSTKSSFVSIEIVLGIMRNPNTHAVVYRKIAADLRESVMPQILWAINTLGVADLWQCKVSPMEVTYLPTKQKIYFKGLDESVKSKSIKAPFGYFKYGWFEELEQFKGMQEIRKTTQSLIRGGNGYCYFYTYNPPQTSANWVNIEAAKNVPNRLVHKSTYLDVPKEWLGEEAIIEAELLKSTNELAYRHEYLGEITGTGGNVFTNVLSQPITDEQIRSFDNIRQGIDWGFAIDPFVWIKCHFDKTRRIVYIYDEVYGVGLTNQDAMDKVTEHGGKHEKSIADCAEPKSIDEFRRSGFNIYAAEKGKDSVRYGIKFLQGMQNIIIDQTRTPHAWEEFLKYEYDRNKDGTFRSDYPDKDNHTIDALRYALERDSTKRGLF